MDHTNYYEIEILRFIYTQPEVTVAVDKLLGKFNKLTKDDMLDLLRKMEEKQYIVLDPKSDYAFLDIESDKETILIPPTHVTLTLAGKSKAEENRVLLLKAKKELVVKPLVNSVISGVVGFLLGIVFSYLLIK